MARSVVSAEDYEASGHERHLRKQPERSPGAPSVLNLQQSAGNRAVANLLGSTPRVQRHEGPSVTEEDGGAAGGNGQAAQGGSEQAGAQQGGSEQAGAQQGGAQQEEGASGGAGGGATAQQEDGGGGGGGGEGTPDGMDVVTSDGKPAQDETPTPGPAGQTSGGTPVVDDATKWSQIQSSLTGHEHGNWAINTVAALGTQVMVNSTDPGSFFAPSENKIHLNRSLTAPTAASVFVHEAFHAWSSRTHHTADIHSLSRDAYVTAMINEETSAVINQISLVTEQGASEAPGGVPSAAMYTAYSRAWKKAHDEATGDEPAKKAAGDAAGRTVVNGWFYDGTFVTSTTNQPYATYYGVSWDGVHNPPAHGS